MKTTVIQMNSQNDKQANLQQASVLIESAVKQDNPDLIVLPEVFNYIGADAEYAKAIAEPIPGGKTYCFLQALAKKHDIVLHAGSIVEKQDGKLYNTTVVFAANGDEIAKYQKIHMFDVTTPDGFSYRESDTLTQGNKVITYKWKDKTIGAVICYDLRFANLFQKLVAKGVDVIIIPAAFTYPTGQAHWEILLRARALDCQCYIVAANQCGQFPYKGEMRQSWGHSMIVDPWGKIMVSLGFEKGFATAHLDFDFTQRVRSDLPVLKTQTQLQ